MSTALNPMDAPPFDAACRERLLKDLELDFTAISSDSSITIVEKKHLRAALAHIEKLEKRLAEYSRIPKSGPNAVLDQTDADNYYLSKENAKLKATVEAQAREFFDMKNAVNFAILRADKAEAELSRVQARIAELEGR